jgi:hypothetical protein
MLSIAIIISDIDAENRKADGAVERWSRERRETRFSVIDLIDSNGFQVKGTYRRWKYLG